MIPMFFPTPEDFRKWLEENHQLEKELIVGYYKVNSGKASMTWSESVDVALCYGWIDGIKHTIDEESYQIRFTPRKENSIWSAVNIDKVEKLIAQGLMKAEGLAIFEKRKESNSRVYSFENEEVKFSPEFEQMFRANTKAWEYFQSLAPSYRKPSSNWVMSAKQESTQLKRLKILIEDSENGTNQWKDNKYKKK